MGREPLRPRHPAQLAKPRNPSLSWETTQLRGARAPQSLCAPHLKGQQPAKSGGGLNFFAVDRGVAAGNMQR